METTNTDGLVRLSKLAENLFDAETEVERIHNDLDTADNVRRQLAETEIPELMQDLGMEKFTTKSGLTISAKETIRANLAKVRLQAGLAWLRENGHGGLIKTAVSVPFSKGGDDDAQLLVDRLNGEGISASYESKVHAGTLSAAVKTMLEEGEEVPFDLFKVLIQRVAKIEKK